MPGSVLAVKQKKPTVTKKSKMKVGRMKGESWERDGQTKLMKNMDGRVIKSKVIPAELTSGPTIRRPSQKNRFLPFQWCHRRKKMRS